MGKTVYFLIMFMACLPAIFWAAEDDKYLAGAVPEVDGKVVFTKEFDLPGVNQDAIYDYVYSWLDSRMKDNNNVSRIVFADKEKGQIVAAAEEHLLFASNALSLDRSIINYNLSVLCMTGKCQMQIERMRYNYEGKKYTAEEMIADNIALNKKKNDIFRGYKKFRINTIDFVDNMFDSARVTFGIKNDKDEQTLVAVQSRQTTLPTSQPTASIPDELQTGVSLMNGYKQLSPDKIPGNIIKMISEDWMLITAGTDEKFNMMTAGWGGLGTLFGRPVAFCVINTTRYTYQLMKTNDTYTFTFYTEAYREALRYCGSNSGRDGDKVKGSGLTPISTPLGSKAFSEAWLIIECRKLIGQPIDNNTLYDEKVKAEWATGQLYKMFIGEIINVWVK